MLTSNSFYTNKIQTYRFLWRILLASFFLFPGNFFSIGQSCPPNIDFERGNFDGWTCYVGNTAAINGQNVISLSPTGGPLPNHHTMLSSNPGDGLDPFGEFPKNCPNGSGHSIKLGNNRGGGEAEGVSYEFTIPDGQDEYSIIYHYAVVFQDPNHLEFQQPRLEIEVTNVTDNIVISCASLTFIPFGPLIPGFFVSPTVQDSTNVWCKDWSAVSVNLNGNAGKIIRLFFKTADCTFTRHFGYAYIDVNSECNSDFIGARYCPDDTAVNVTAPFGYEKYTWFNNNFTQVLGKQQTITFMPPPALGTNIAVEVVPYNGYGCLDTIFAKLVNTLTITSNAGPDVLSCNQKPVQIGANATPGLSYSWSPPVGLSGNDVSNPRAGPPVTTTYVLTTRHDGGGCATTDTVVVKAVIIDSTLELIGKSSYCLNTGDSAVLLVNPTDSITWFKDGISITGLVQPRIRATQSGVYYAQLAEKGCRVNTPKQKILIDKPVPSINYPVQYALVNYPLQLQARPFGISAEWSPTIGLDNFTTYDPVFKSPSDELYTVTIRTQAGCVTVDTQLVKTIKEIKIHVPTGFTPNNDGLNDYLKPISFGIKQFTYFRVYNRWGQLVFDLKKDPKGWDGMVDGKPQSSQVVVWMVEGIGVDNRIYRQKGTTMLIR